MATVSRGLVKYEGSNDYQHVHGGARSGDPAWRFQNSMAASYLAAATLQAGMPRIAAFRGERSLSGFLAERMAVRRRNEVLKFLVVTMCEVVGVAAGLYIGAMQ